MTSAFSLSSFRVLFPALAFAAALFAATAAWAGYSAAIEDLPVMPQMTERADSIVFFDTPEGRIIETSFDTAGNSRQVLSYYHQVLPPLGWTRMQNSNNAYTRKNETLVIEFKASGSAAPNTVRIRLVPAAQQ